MPKAAGGLGPAAVRRGNGHPFSSCRRGLGLEAGLGEKRPGYTRVTPQPWHKVTAKPRPLPDMRGELPSNMPPGSLASQSHAVGSARRGAADPKPVTCFPAARLGRMSLDAPFPAEYTTSRSQTDGRFASQEETMARVLKGRPIRRAEILDLAQRLVYSKGYEQMTIQDILDGLQISKGAFYHYFESKQALLEAVVGHMIDELLQLVSPIMQDPGLPALEKLQRFYDTAARWKTAQKAYLLALYRVWYSDDNAVARQKMVAAAVRRITPLLTQVIRQGIGEGVFSTSYPDQAGEVVMSLIQSLGEAIVAALFSDEPKPEAARRIENTVAAYAEAMERVLRAPAGSLHLMDAGMLEEWLVAARENPADPGAWPARGISRSEPREGSEPQPVRNAGRAERIPK